MLATHSSSQGVSYELGSPSSTDVQLGWTSGEFEDQVNTSNSLLCFSNHPWTIFAESSHRYQEITFLWKGVHGLQRCLGRWYTTHGWQDPLMIWVSCVFLYGSCGFLCSPSRGTFKSSSVLHSLTVYQLPHSGNYASRVSCLVLTLISLCPQFSHLRLLTCSAVSWPLLVKFTKPACKLIPGERNYSPAGPPSQHHSWISGNVRLEPHLSNAPPFRQTLTPPPSLKPRTFSRGWISVPKVRSDLSSSETAKCQLLLHRIQ